MLPCTLTLAGSMQHKFKARFVNFRGAPTSVCSMGGCGVMCGKTAHTVQCFQHHKHQTAGNLHASVAVDTQFSHTRTVEMRCFAYADMLRCLTLQPKHSPSSRKVTTSKLFVSI